MKRFLVLCGFLFLAGSAHASQVVGKSSSTLVSVPVGVLCASGQRAMVYRVSISSGGAQGSGVMLFNSSFSLTGIALGPIDARTVQNQEYDTGFPKGLIYTSTGTQSQSIIYDCY